MKICFLMVSHWTGTVGGAELQVRYIMDYLHRHTSHELSMICRHSKVESEYGAPILRTHAPPVLRRYLKSADYWSVRELLRRIDPDVVYSRVCSPFAGIAARHCRQFDRKLIYHIAHVQDVTPLRASTLRRLPKKLERPLYEYGLRRADVIIGQAKYQDDLLWRHYRRRCAAIVPNVHPDPGDVSKASGKTTVMWVASLKEPKRPELVVELARRFGGNPSVEFVMVGPVQDPRYLGLAETIRSMGNLRYLGEQPVEEVNRLLEGAHLFVNTSTSNAEGFPNSFIQSWLRRVPTVSLDVDPDDLLQSRGLGVCAGGSFERLVEVIQSLVSSPARMSSMGTAAREFALATHGLDNLRELVRLIEAPLPARTPTSRA